MRRNVRMMSLVGLAVATGISASAAEVVTTAASVRSFLGGATGKLVYTKLDCDDNSCNKQGHSLWYVDFSEATLTERQIIRLNTSPWNENGEPRNTVITMDGQWVVFNVLDQDNRWRGSQLYACRLQPNVTTRISYGRGALPRVWQRPGTAEWYIIYNDKDLEENGGWAMSFPWYEASTWCRQVNPTTMQPVGEGRQLLDCLANGNRSKNGAWMFAAGGVPGTLRIDPSVVAGASALEEVSLSVNAGDMTDSLDGCNPSMSPHESEIDLRVMYVCNDDDNNHRAYWLCSVRGNHRVRVHWNCTENPYIDEPEWCPTHPDYGAAKASLRNTTAPFDIYLFRVWDGQYLKVLEGNYSFPYLWIDPASIVARRHFSAQKTVGSWQGQSRHLADIRGRMVDNSNAAHRVPGAYVEVGPGENGRAAVIRQVVVREGTP